MAWHSIRLLSEIVLVKPLSKAIPYAWMQVPTVPDTNVLKLRVQRNSTFIWNDMFTTYLNMLENTF